MVIIHRILRILPAYMLVLLFYTTLSPYLINTSPNRFLVGLQTDAVDVANCRKNWWSNLLFINNFVPDNSDHTNLMSCMAWSWYLAVDMQLFVLTPFVVLPFTFTTASYNKLGWVLAILLLIASSIANFVQSLDNNFDAGAATSNPLYFSANYVKPWMRCQPYIVGILTSVLYVQHKEQITRIFTPKVVLFSYLLVLMVPFFITFGANGEIAGAWGFASAMTAVSSAFYLALSRLGWGLALGIITLLCISPFGGVMNGFLSSVLWLPMARMSFCAYLVHPIVLNTYYGNLSENRYDYNTILYSFGGALFWTYIAAFVATLFLEMPFAQLEKLLLP